jgi:hypothetical protein
MLDLFNQLHQVPPCVKPFAWVGYLLSFCCSEAELSQKLELHAHLLLGQFNPSNSLTNRI